LVIAATASSMDISTVVLDAGDGAAFRLELIQSICDLSAGQLRDRPMVQELPIARQVALDLLEGPGTAGGLDVGKVAVDDGAK
jgi:hypothetical protein